METFEPQHMLQVVSRCFQIMMSYNEEGWRRESDVVLMPDVGAIPWDGFQNSMLMIEAVSARGGTGAAADSGVAGEGGSGGG